MAAKFELFTDEARQEPFPSEAANGEIIAASHAYESKASARTGIESVKHNAGDATVDDQTP